MKLIAVDDEKLALENLLLKIQQIEFVEHAETFRSPQKALDYLKDNEVDVALLDINMQLMDGLILAKRIKETRSSVKIIFLTGYSEFAVQAFKLHVKGYLLKPVSVEELREDLLYVMNRQNESEEKHEEKRVRIQCFGDFEVFINNEAVHFHRNKTKELLAYLVDRFGASCNTSTLCAILWEDELETPSMKSQLRNSIAELSHIFEEAGCEQVLVKNRNSYAIKTDEVDCDYYGFRKRDPKAINLYNGEYMSQYSWAELTLGSIESER